MRAYDAPIPAHDDDLGNPDALTGFRVNYRWRMLITELLMPLSYDANWRGTEADTIDAVNKATNLINDLYTPIEGSGDMVFMGAQAKLQTNFLATPTWQPIAFEFDSGGGQYDTDDIWDIAQPTRFTVPVGGAGWWRVWCQAVWNNAAYNAFLQIRTSGSGNGYNHFTVNGVWTTAYVHRNFLMADGDYAEIYASTSGGSRTITFNTQWNYAALGGMWRVGDSA